MKKKIGFLLFWFFWRFVAVSWWERRSFLLISGSLFGSKL
ncbi:hypothetical protein HSIEG1_455 [Enterococcus sp. HSIEG1]|nr:hypothetical protein HSIEG1_455 [Enterococcus sp. HSIEG1]